MFRGLGFSFFQGFGFSFGFRFRRFRVAGFGVFRV